MKKGAYRLYFHVPFTNIGIKFARFNLRNANSYCGFLTGIIMNILERKRYKRYMLGENLGNYKWEICRDYNLNPTYFSLFGLFNIVRHVDDVYNERWEGTNGLTRLLVHYQRSPFCEGLKSCGIYDGKLVEIDYGDFTVYSYKHTTVTELDYK